MRNLWYKFCSLKTWQKLAIGISLLSIFKVFAYHNFILDVSAKSLDTPYVVVVNPVTGESETVGFNESPPYKSDFISQSNLERMTNSSQNPYSVDTTAHYINNNDNNIYSGSQNGHGNILANTTLSFYDTSGWTGYLTNFNFNGSNSAYSGNIPRVRPLHKDIEYTFLFELYGNNVTFNSVRDSDIQLSMGYCWNTTDSSHDCASLMNKVDIIEKTFISPGDLTYTNEHYAFFKVTFKTNELFPEDNNSDKYALEYINFGLDNSNLTLGEPVDMTDFKFFVSSSTGGSFTIKNIYITQYSLVIGDKDYSSLNGESLNLTKYETCDTLDIACHLRNLVRGIQSITSNIIFSFKQLFNALFLPDFTLINEKIDNISSTFRTKFPDVYAFIQYLDYFKTRLDNIQRQTVISYNGVKFPGSNSYVIPAFTFDFNTIINDPIISPYYLTARVVITSIMSFFWVFFSIRIIMSIIHDTVAMKGD